MDSAAQAVQQALLQQVTAYIAQYTPNPRIISYKPNENGDVMGRVESQSRVFTFRLSSKGLVYKPLIPRKDGESDSQYALRFDTGSELYLEHFDATKARAFTPKPSISIPATKKQRGTKQNPVCGATSYHCGVCISLGKNCIKNANTAVLKERLSKINSLARMAAKGQAVPQVKTGVIGAKTDLKSLLKKAQNQARSQFKDGKTSTNPEKLLSLKIDGKRISVPRGSEIVAVKDNHIQSQIVGQPAYRIAPKNGNQSDYIRETQKGQYAPVLKFKTPEQAIKYAEKINKAIAREEKRTSTPKDTPSSTQEHIANLTDRIKEISGKKNPTQGEQEEVANLVDQRKELLEGRRTTTLQTPFPLTTQAQKRLERGESISDNETYHVKKEGDKFRVTDPNKFEDKGKLVDKAGLAQHMKELEAQPREPKKSSSQNPIIPINDNPDTMLRALRNGRLIGDRKQGYEIQEHPSGKGSYLVTTMPNGKGDYNGVMSRKELVSFIRSGGDGARFKKEGQFKAKNPAFVESKEQQLAKAKKVLPVAVQRHLEDQAYTEVVKENGGVRDQSANSESKSDWQKRKTFLEGDLTQDQKEALRAYGDHAREKALKDYEDVQAKAKQEQSTNGKQKSFEEMNPVVINSMMKNAKDTLKRRVIEIESEKRPERRSELKSEIEDLQNKIEKMGNALPKDHPQYIPSKTSQKKQSRSTNQIAIDRAKNDVGNATKAINKLDQSIKSLKAGSGVMSEADLKRVTSLERQKAEWEAKREQHRAKVVELSKGKDVPTPKIDRQNYKNINSVLPESLDNDKKTMIARRIADFNHGQDIITDDSIKRALGSVALNEDKKLKDTVVKALKENGFKVDPPLNSMSPQDMIASLSRSNEDIQDKKDKIASYAQSNGLKYSDLMKQFRENGNKSSQDATPVKAEPQSRLTQTDLFGNSVAIAEPDVAVVAPPKPKAKKQASSKIDVFTPEMKAHAEKVLKDAEKGTQDQPITIDLTKFGGGKYEVKPTPEAIKTFREVLAKAKTQTDANFKASGGGLSKATEKEYQLALGRGEIDKPTYDLLVGNSAKEFPDTVKVKHSLRSKDGSFATVNAKKVGNYAIHQRFKGVTDDDEVITSPKEYTLTHLGSGMKAVSTEDMGDKKTPLKVKKARIEAFADELSKRIPDIDPNNITPEQKAIIKELKEKAKRGDYDSRKDSADLYYVRIPSSILVSTTRKDSVTDKDQILTYVTDNSGNMMGIVQLGGIKYRFLKPIFGKTVLTPINETSLGYLFDLAPDLTLPQGNLLDAVLPCDSLKKKTMATAF